MKKIKMYALKEGKWTMISGMMNEVQFNLTAVVKTLEYIQLMMRILEIANLRMRQKHVLLTEIYKRLSKM